MMQENLKYTAVKNRFIAGSSIKFLFFFLILTINASFASAQMWVEDTFEDFADGTLDASGNNIYVSRDGKIRTIHKFDLNNDSYIDLLFCQTHNGFNIIPATLAEISPDRKIRESDLAIEGSLQTETADLNHDGYPDLVFCPNYKGVQNTRRFVTLIYGGEDGWSSQRSAGQLPVDDMKTVAIADLNHDGWEDIITLNGEAWAPAQPSGKIIRIFWGGARGFINTRYYDIGIPGAIGITTGDFDNDNSADLAILKENRTISVYWAILTKEKEIKMDTTSIQLPESPVISIASGDCNNDKKLDILVGTSDKTIYILSGQPGRKWKEQQNIESDNASGIVTGDIDKDGYNDLLISSFSQRFAAGGEFLGAKEGFSEAVNILWGTENGFSLSHSTSLKAKNLSSSAFGDFDGDGINDVAIAINRGDVDFKAQSIIYYGLGNRKFVKGEVGINTIGAFHVLAVPVKNSKRSKVIFANSMGGRIDEKCSSYLYWGGADGFREKNRVEIPMRSAYEATAADFNADGETDLVILDAMHGGQTLAEDPWAGANIFRGKGGNIDFTKRSVLSESECGSSNTADLNKDGYLDLVLGQFANSSILIYYGSKTGFSNDHRVSIPCSGRSLGLQLADYNKDGWLDIAVASYAESLVKIYYGSADGFDISRKGEVDAPSVIDLETADFNKDGWLDIVGCCYNDKPNNSHFDMGVLLFWGGPKGFHQTNAQWLPASCPLGPVVADLDSDGYLDLFIPSYHADLTRETIPSYIYWGGTDGFHPRNRTPLINDSGSDGLAADFNKDGKLDIAVSNHSMDGNHNTSSKVFYNDGNRFSNPRIEKIPTVGPHWSMNEDMGNIYDRSWKQNYESSIFQWNKKRIEGRIDCIAEIPNGTQLVLWIRSSARKAGLASENWIRTDNTGHFKINPENRFLQYKAIFISDNGDRFPVLDKVTINMDK